MRIKRAANASRKSIVDGDAGTVAEMLSVDMGDVICAGTQDRRVEAMKRERGSAEAESQVGSAFGFFLS